MASLGLDHHHHRRAIRFSLLSLFMMMMIIMETDAFIPYHHHCGRKILQHQQKLHHQQPSTGPSLSTSTSSSLLVVHASARPPWQRSRGKKGEDENDEFWILEKSLMTPPVMPEDKAAAHGNEDIEEEDDELIGTGEKADVLKEVLIVEPGEAKMRADRFLAERLKGQSRSALGELLDAGMVTINGAKARKSVKVEAGDKLEVGIKTAAAQVDLEPQDIPLDILYEDDHMLAACKAPGMVVHPAPGNRDGTFVNALLYHLKMKGVTIETNAGAEGRPGIVHRLDKGTSGVLLAAKTAQAHAVLSAAFSERRVNKTYLAICIGNPGSEMVIDAPIGRHPKDRQRMSVAMNAIDEVGDGGDGEEEYIMGRGAHSSGPVTGRTAKSIVRSLAFDGRLSVAQVEIETGRTHQIRVHLQHKRHPVLGDELYGNAQWNNRAKKRWAIDRPMLHALRIEIDHPVTGKPLQIVAPVPEDMMNVVKGIWPDCMAPQAGQRETPWWEGGTPVLEEERVVPEEEEEVEAEEVDDGIDPFWK